MFAEKWNTEIGKHFGLRQVKGTFGIEIETEGANLPGGKITKTFTGKEDGSLRNGMEYVSIPIDLVDMEERVENLRAEIAAKKGVVNPSYRSSTHIHVNYTNHRWHDVLGSMVIWSLVEPVVFHMMPPGRDGSLFCVSNYDSGDAALATDTLCTDIGKDFYRGFNPRGKYSAQNLTRLGDLGTVEYRVFPTSLDGKQIASWARMCGNIRDMAAKQPSDIGFLPLVREAEQNPVPFLRGIFGELPPIPDIGRFVDFGARNAFEQARIIHRHLTAKPAKRRTTKDQLMEAMEAPAAPAAPFPIPELGGGVGANRGRLRPRREPQNGRRVGADDPGGVEARPEWERRLNAVQRVNLARWRRHEQMLRNENPDLAARYQHRIERLQRQMEEEGF